MVDHRLKIGYLITDDAAPALRQIHPDGVN